jgi:hypothetical protein
VRISNYELDEGVISWKGECQLGSCTNTWNMAKNKKPARKLILAGLILKVN